MAQVTIHENCLFFFTRKPGPRMQGSFKCFVVTILALKRYKCVFVRVVGAFGEIFVVFTYRKPSSLANEMHFFDPDVWKTESRQNEHTGKGFALCVNPHQNVLNKSRSRRRRERDLFTTFWWGSRAKQSLCACVHFAYFLFSIHQGRNSAFHWQGLMACGT